MSSSGVAFRKCSTCKDPIAFEAEYFACSVSTCNKKRAPLYFCSLGCWDAHQAGARHRDAWAEQERAPSQAEWAAAQRSVSGSGSGGGRATAEASAPAAPRPREISGRVAHEVLVVMSRLKEYVKDHAGMATSDRVAGVLSDHLRELLDDAAVSALNDHRKTLLERDVEPLVDRRSAALGTSNEDDASDVVLVIVLKVKQYVRESSALSTSDAILPLLSGHVRHLAREACRAAARDDRKTVLDRDVLAAIDRLP
jgi:histone H3/H4